VRDRLAGALSKLQAALDEVLTSQAMLSFPFASCLTSANHQPTQAERARLAGALAKLQAELDEVRGREGVASRKLDGYRAEHEGLAAELADLEAHLQRKVSFRFLSPQKPALEQCQKHEGLTAEVVDLDAHLLCKVVTAPCATVLQILQPYQHESLAPILADLNVYRSAGLQPPMPCQGFPGSSFACSRPAECLICC